MAAQLATPPGAGTGRSGPALLRSATGRRSALAGLLVLAGLLYSLGLSASGWANSYYSAASHAGAVSWRAMLFGGLDPGGDITVDKPPGALWPTDLSVRLFGLSTQSLLLPQAACTVVSVALLYGVVRRQALTIDPAEPDSEARAAAVGLVAAATLALTPVVTLMGRYDNPDALMVTLSLGAAYALVRSVGVARGGGSWLALSGALLGLSFLTKLLQAWLILPAFLAVALVAGAGTIRRRLARILAAGLAMVAAAGWWVLVVQLTPASERPWIGGSQHNSVLELALGYNGLGRLTGQEGQSGASDVARRSGTWFRLFGSWAPEASWLLPAALLCLPAGWLLTAGRGRRDPARAGLLLWGGWLLGAGVVLSSLRGISHSYYAVQLAPAIAGAVALGGALLERAVRTPAARAWPRWVLAVGVAGTALWATGLLLRRPAWPVGLAPLALIAAVVAVRGVLPPRRPGRGVGAAALVAVLVGPASWSVATAQAVHRGANVVAGPGAASARTPAGVAPDSTSSARFPTALVDLVRAGASGHDWAAAVVGRQAADLQLDTGAAVWCLGGYNGVDPYPTAPEFAAAVGRHRVHYLLLGDAPTAPGTEADRIARWAALALPSRRMGGWRVIDLDHPSISSGGLLSTPAGAAASGLPIAAGAAA